MLGWWKEFIDIVKENDPAARTSLEVLLTYPGIKALAAHRLSHFLWRHGFKLLARMHSQFWRFWTQIEIHPGAQIESGVFIDHGSGLVIGETAIVEKGAMLYHGVTLGGTGKDTGKRHPTVCRGDQTSAYSFSPSIRLKTTFTGYLDPMDRLPSGEEEDVDPESARWVELDVLQQDFTLCVIGGGQDGLVVASAFARSQLPEGEYGIMVTGPFLPEEKKRQLRSQADRDRKSVV